MTDKDDLPSFLELLGFKPTWIQAQLLANMGKKRFALPIGLPKRSVIPLFLGKPCSPYNPNNDRIDAIHYRIKTMKTDKQIIAEQVGTIHSQGQTLERYADEVESLQRTIKEQKNLIELLRARNRRLRATAEDRRKEIANLNQDRTRLSNKLYARKEELESVKKTREDDKRSYFHTIKQLQAFIDKLEGRAEKRSDADVDCPASIYDTALGTDAGRPEQQVKDPQDLTMLSRKRVGLILGSAQRIEDVLRLSSKSSTYLDSELTIIKEECQTMLRGETLYFNGGTIDPGKSKKDCQNKFENADTFEKGEPVGLKDGKLTKNPFSDPPLMSPSIQKELRRGLSAMIRPQGCIILDETKDITSEDIDRITSQLKDHADVESILDKAKSLVGGDRQNDYGSPAECWGRIADMFNAYLSNKLKDKLSAREASDLMILLKVARSANKYKEDNYTDIAGYAQVSNLIATEEDAKHGRR